MVRVKIYLVDNSLHEYIENEPAFISQLKELIEMGYEGKKLIETLISDDWAAPPKFVKIKGTDLDGIHIDMSILYEDNNTD